MLISFLVLIWLAWVLYSFVTQQSLNHLFNSTFYDYKGYLMGESRYIIILDTLITYRNRYLNQDKVEHFDIIIKFHQRNYKSNKKRLISSDGEFINLVIAWMTIAIVILTEFSWLFYVAGVVATICLIYFFILWVAILKLRSNREITLRYLNELELDNDLSRKIVYEAIG